jgi:hypothetical protein
LAKVCSEDYVDPQYKRLMSKKKGSKLIQVLRELAKGAMTINGIAGRTSFSVSEVKKLVSFGTEEQYIEKCRGKGGISRRPGKPKKREFEKETGRPPDYYYLSEDGGLLIRFDPAVREHWNEVERTYGKAFERSIFESYYALVHAMRQHPRLKKYRKAGNFMENELPLAVFSPFIFGNEHGMRETDLYDELVNTIKVNVKPEHVLSYYLALEGSLQEFNALLEHHKLLTEKMKKIPQVQEYLKKHSS